MTFLTFVFILRSLVWALAASVVATLLIGLSWTAWSRATEASAPVTRYRIVVAHYMAIVASPFLMLALGQRDFVSLGPQIVRASPTGDAAILVDLGVFADLPLLIAGVWLTGGVLCLFRLGRDVGALHRLPQTPASLELRSAVHEILGKRGDIPAIFTADVDSPLVFGIGRPVLILPPGFLDQRSAEQNAAILLHELAHVDRRDYAWNLLQRATLASLWFHPVTWYFYRILALERESCCDALALDRGASPIALAHAIVDLAARETPAAMAVSGGHRSHLAARVNRLVRTRVPSSAPTSAKAFAAGASLLCACTLILYQPRLADGALLDLFIASGFGPSVHIAAHDGAGNFILLVRQGRVMKATVDGKSLATKLVVQTGSKVRLRDDRGRTLVDLHVTPGARIMWTGRGPQLTRKTGADYLRHPS